MIYYINDVQRDISEIMIDTCDSNKTKSCQVATSTPHRAHEVCLADGERTPDVSVIENVQDSKKDSAARVHFKRGKPQEVEELYFNKAKTEASRSGNSEPNKTSPCCEEVLPESIGSFSIVDSGSGSCDTGARAHYYHNKLLSIMQIVENKEETVRIQSESLSVAEARIATLTVRVTDLRNEIDRKDRELKTLRKSADSRVEKTDVSISAHFEEKDNQNNIVNTLQNNLCVIEDLYRESFYETVKQEGLIDMLRKSYLDVRLMDKEKSDQIGRLQNVINTQRWSVDQCQDVAMEVENLKLEISNFLNSSNNDSGMWERSDVSAASGIGEDLHDIVEHLLRLRVMLTGDCTCGLEEENMRLKQTNEMMEIQMDELRQRMLDNDDMDRQYKEQIDFKEKELHGIRKQLVAVEAVSRDQSTTCDTLSDQLQHTQELLDDKTAELLQVQERCEAQDLTLKQLKEELDQADGSIQEKCRVRCEAGELRARIAHVDAAYREQARAAAALRAQLEGAHARGAALGAGARRAVCTVRAWARRARDQHRDQEEKIREKELLLCSLQERLQGRQNDASRPSGSEYAPSCSRCVPVQERGSPDVGTRCTPKARERREQRAGLSGSETASCSSAPVPPRRMRKMLPFSERRCEGRDARTGARDAGAQRPERRDVTLDTRSLDQWPAHAITHTHPCAPARSPSHCHYHWDQLRVRTAPRELSPPEELLSRVEGMSEALAARARRRLNRD